MPDVGADITLARGEVVALVEDGRLALGQAETAPLDQINNVYARLKRGDVRGRVIITPSA